MEILREKMDDLGVKFSRDLVLQLKRSLYGLKQVGRLWYEFLQKTLLEMGFTQCLTDTCIFVQNKNGEMVLIGVYVDN